MSELALTSANFRALPARRAYGARWRAAIVRFFTADDTGGKDRTRRVYPTRHHYIEDAAMRRAMERL